MLSWVSAVASGFCSICCDSELILASFSAKEQRTNISQVFETQMFSEEFTFKSRWESRPHPREPRSVHQQRRDMIELNSDGGRTSHIFPTVQ